MGLSKKQLQVVETLENNVQLCKEFMNDWLLFNQILSSYPSPGVNKAQLENQFLKIKSKLAREHKVLRENLRSDYTLDENTMNIVSGATNLESIYSQSEVAVRKLQNEWHRAFIAINETLGGLEDKKNRAERGEKVFLDPTEVRVRSGMSKNTKTLLIVFGILIALILIIVFVPQAEPWRAPLRDLGIPLP